jgi:uncharacterized protein YuzE
MRDFRPYARFSPSADAIYVYLSDQPVAYTRELDDYRLIDYSADGAVVGIEFLAVSGGIDLGDIPLPAMQKAALLGLLKDVTETGSMLCS